MRLKRLSRITLGILTVLSLIFAVNLKAHSFFHIQPMSFKNLVVKKGETVILTLHVFNPDKTPARLAVYPTDYRINRRGEQIFQKLQDLEAIKESVKQKLEEVRRALNEDTTRKLQRSKEGLERMLPSVEKRIQEFSRTQKYSAPSWIKLKGIKDEEIIVSPESKENIEFEIRVPYNIRPGEYYAAIMVRDLEGQSIKGSPVNVKLSQPCWFIVTVPGRLPKIRGKAVSAEVEAKKEGIRIMATFKNMGNVLEEVTGKAHIVNKESRRVCDIVTLKALNPSSSDGMGKVFPESLRDFQDEVRRPLPAGEYEVRVVFHYGKKGRRRTQIKTFFTLTETVAVEQKKLLILAVEPELLKYSLIPGGYHIEGIEVENVDTVESMEVVTQSNVEWLKVYPDKFKLAPERSRKVRVAVRIPRNTETVERSGKIIFKAGRGKPAFVDVFVHDARKD